MTTQHDPTTRMQGPGQRGGHGRSGHSWMMIACCIPMLVIAGILVATGAASPGFLVVAVGCTLMMALADRDRDFGDRWSRARAWRARPPAGPLARPQPSAVTLLWLDGSAGRPVTAWGFRYRPSRWRHALGSAGPGRRW